MAQIYSRRFRRETMFSLRSLLTAWCLFVMLSGTALAQHDPELAEVYRRITRQGSDYVVADSTVLYETMRAGTPVVILQRGEPVHRLRQSHRWTRIRTRTGAVGYVRTTDISNMWIMVSKNRHMLYVYRGMELVEKLPVDLAVNFKGDKVRRGSYMNPEDWRTPEGLFYITWKRASSQFYKALVLSYPGPSHAARGLEQNLISRDGYARIVKANQLLENPPMNTLLGGWIEIHGHGIDGRANWTQGCIALENADIDRLWQYVHEGTAVFVSSYTRDAAQTEPMLITHLLPAGKRRHPVIKPAASLYSRASTTNE
ncbi:MAG: L,D-transpeptidase [Rhodothermales bacterium]|jgi:lipoprotein-anchoring transpeptidase ErfK/SrfK